MELLGRDVSEEDLLDPEADVHALFVHYNLTYFNGEIGACTVEWSSSRMTLCAGVCSFSPTAGCRIKLSAPLLQLRPKKDLKETLLHEMIHAHLFLQGNLEGREDHGPKFQAIMHAINRSHVLDPERPAGGYNITIYHTMNEEVDYYRTHHWTCNRCGNVIKRSMNRKPQEMDCITRKGRQCRHPHCTWHNHLILCGGEYIKTATPHRYPREKKHAGKSTSSQGRTNMKPITAYFQGKTSTSEPIVVDLTKD